MIKILFICHGNICRSTMAEFVMKELVRQRGIADLVLYLLRRRRAGKRLATILIGERRRNCASRGFLLRSARPCRLPRPITRRTIILSALTGKTIMKFAAFAGRTTTARYILSCLLPGLTEKWLTRGIREISTRPMKMSIWAAGHYWSTSCRRNRARHD